jgi:hypothetical protein
MRGVEWLCVALPKRLLKVGQILASRRTEANWLPPKFVFKSVVLVALGGQAKPFVVYPGNQYSTQ